MWRQETLDILFDIENHNNSKSDRSYCYGRLDETDEEDEDDEDEDEVDTEIKNTRKEPIDLTFVVPSLIRDESCKSDVDEKTTRKNNRCCFNIFNFDYTFAQYEYERNASSPDREAEAHAGTQAQTQAGAQAQLEKQKQKRVRVKRPTVESALYKLSKRIENYLEETEAFIKKYNLSGDDFMKQLISNVTTSQKTLTNNNERTRSDNYSRRLTLGRQRSHSIRDDDNDTELQSTSCFRNGTLDDIILRVSSGTPNKMP